jgi:hypothetical protein
MRTPCGADAEAPEDAAVRRSGETLGARVPRAGEGAGGRVRPEHVRALIETPPKRLAAQAVGYVKGRSGGALPGEVSGRGDVRHRRRAGTRRGSGGASWGGKPKASGWIRWICSKMRDADNRL